MMSPFDSNWNLKEERPFELTVAFPPSLAVMIPSAQSLGSLRD